MRDRIQKGFAHLETLLVLLVIGAIVAIGWYVYEQKPSVSQPTSDSTSSSQPTAKESAGKATELGLPKGYTAKVFTDQVPSARDLAFSPGGTLVVSQLGVNRVVALPDKNKDGVADSVKQVATGNFAHGLAFYKQYLLVAEADKVMRYKWDEASLTATFDKQLFTTPIGGHVNRTLSVYPDGRLYETIGSTCNVCVEADPMSATVIESNINGDNPHVFIRGSRNASFSAINPKTKELWATENSRDLLGDDVPPDEINILRSGKHYGWPYCYGDGIRDMTFNPSTNFDCSTTEHPAYKAQAHSAPLGLVFIDSKQFPATWQGDLLVSFHGSWNRSVPTGYKVVHLKVKGNTISGQEDFLTTRVGVLGRPVDLAFDKSGNLFVSDDRTGAVYIVQRL